MEHMTQEIIDIISSGDVDNDLDMIQAVVLERRAFLPRRHHEDKNGIFVVGATIEVVGRLRPNYLFGHRFEVVKVNDKSVCIDVPDEPRFRRFAGHKSVRMPKTALKVVG